MSNSKELALSMQECVCVCVCVLYLGWNTQSTLRGASMVAQTVKNLPAMQETWV